MAKTIFRNAHIIDPVSGADGVRDVLVVDGVIDKIGERLSNETAQIIDLAGCILAPGFCDMHVHFREPGYEHKETLASGARSALAGGFTSVACMPNTNPPIDNEETLLFVKEKSRALPIDIYPIGAVTKGRAGKELAPMAELFAAGAVAFSDDGSPVFNAKLLRIALEYASMFGVPVIQHAEDPFLFEGGAMNEGFNSTVLGLPEIPRLAEDLIVQRDIEIAAYVNARYHVAHVSTRGAVDSIRQAKVKGRKVTAEVTPHHISLTDDAVHSYDTNTKMNPPLRTMDDVVALKEALRDGTIDAIATDHAPHAAFEKEVEYMYAPFGIVGLETAVGICITELVVGKYLSLYQLIEKMSVNPRKILKLSEIRIEEGSNANFTFIDPDREWVVDVARFQSKSKNSPYNGVALKGKTLGVFLRDVLHWNP